MLKINKDHIKKFEEIKNRFLSKTKIPQENNWEKLTNNDIWLSLITQVMVVGGSAPADKFNSNPVLKNKVSYENLIQIKREEELKKKINEVLRTVGTRYASHDISKCRKTNALVYNLMILKSFRGGPKELLKKLSEFKGKNSDKKRIKYFMKIFKFIQSKSARDNLMSLGFVKNAIALDIRIQKIFKKMGIQLPKGFENNPKLYDEIEKDILIKICEPLGLLGVQFDRLLYQNYREIMKFI
ncbi:MAG: hypothetical protein J7J93_01210 [Candidatus Aenigmarchaeota archaeon]|nr:hypothetical protein [Candidatus Aenigmarchaeota archaeon]